MLTKPMSEKRFIKAAHLSVFITLLSLNGFAAKPNRTRCPEDLLVRRQGTHSSLFLDRSATLVPQIARLTLKKARAIIADFNEGHPRLSPGLSNPQWAQGAAIILTRRWYPELEAGAAFSTKELARQSGLLGLTPSLHSRAYRLDTRAPETFRSSGILPHASLPTGTYWQHIAKGQNGTSNLLSLSLKQKNFPSFDHTHAKWNPVSTKRIRRFENYEIWETTETLYEYQVRDIVGIQTPVDFGVVEKHELVTPQVSSENIAGFREVTRRTYSRRNRDGSSSAPASRRDLGHAPVKIDFGPWQDMPAPTE